MLGYAQPDILWLQQTVLPFEFDVFGVTRRETVTPAWINGELATDACVLKQAVIGETGFFLEFPHRRLSMSFAGMQAARHRLPELDRL